MKSHFILSIIWLCCWGLLRVCNMCFCIIRGPKHSRTEDLSGQQEQWLCKGGGWDLLAVWQSAERYMISWMHLELIDKHFMLSLKCNQVFLIYSVSILSLFFFIQSIYPIIFSAIVLHFFACSFIIPFLSSHRPSFLQMTLRSDSSPTMAGRPKAPSPKLMFIAKWPLSSRLLPSITPQ